VPSRLCFGQVLVVDAKYESDDELCAAQAVTKDGAVYTGWNDREEPVDRRLSKVRQGIPGSFRQLSTQNIEKI
jgi:hypothetical protein